MNEQLVLAVILKFALSKLVRLNLDLKSVRYPTVDWDQFNFAVPEHASTL